MSVELLGRKIDKPTLEPEWPTQSHGNGLKPPHPTAIGAGEGKVPESDEVIDQWLTDAFQIPGLAESLPGFSRFIEEFFPYVEPTAAEKAAMKPGLDRFMRRAHKEGLIRPQNLGQRIRFAAEDAKDFLTSKSGTIARILR